MDRIALSPDVIFFEYCDGGILYNFKDGKEYSIGINELTVVRCIKSNSLSTLLDNNIDNRKVQRIIDRLYDLGLLMEENKNTSCSKSRLNEFGKFKMLQIRDEPKWSKAFPFALISTIILLSPLILLPITYVVSIKTHLDIEKIMAFKVEYWPYYILGGTFGFILPGILHEFSHAVTGKSYGCHVVEIGLRIRFFFVGFYVRIAGINRTTKTKRIHIYLAGMIYNLSAGLISALGVCLFGNQTILNGILIIHLIANFEMLFVNSMCFLRCDGDRVLQELTGEKSFFSRLKKMNKNEKKLLILLLAFSLLSSIISISKKILLIPYLAHILAAVYIAADSRLINKCAIYCLLWQTYGYMTPIIYILLGNIHTWQDAVSITFVLILSVNFFTVWLGTLFYLILKAMKVIPHKRSHVL